MATNAAKVRAEYFRIRQYVMIDRVPQVLNWLSEEIASAIACGDIARLDKLSRQLGAYAFFLLDYTKANKQPKQLEAKDGTNI